MKRKKNGLTLKKPTIEWFRTSVLTYLSKTVKDGKSEEELRAWCLANGIAADETMGKGKLIDEIFGEFCEGNYIQPTFITDYPKKCLLYARNTETTLN